jgi:hypothetical protein
MPFKPATKEIGFVKASMFGPKGTGKTTLLAMLLIHLSKTYHNSAPVAWLASEKGVDFVTDIFAAERVPLLLNRSRSFLDLRSASRDALKEGCCAVGVDSVSHFWQDLFTEGMKARGPRLQRIGRIKEEWAPFAQDFQDSAIHFLVTGRMGFVWDEVEMPDEKGELVKELSKSGTKIKAEGDFGHEPDLEIETAQIDDPDLVRFEKIGGRARRNFKSQMIHVATVKKCRVWSLNGKAFTWKDQTAYKADYYKKVAEAFQPYFDSINIGGAHATVNAEHGSSAVLFDNDSTCERSYYEAALKRQIALEKWAATMAIIAGGQSKDSIRMRRIVGETITGTRSQTEFERQPLEAILRSLQVLLALEQRLKVDSPTSDEEIKACCAMAAEDIDHPGKNSTLLEAMLVKSVESVNGKRWPQPGLAAMDTGREVLSF